jgi:hypothetical protein
MELRTTITVISFECLYMDFSALYNSIYVD